LLKLLRSSHPHVIVASVAAVRNISIHDTNEQKMVTAGFLAPLLQLTGFMSTNSTTNTSALSIGDEIRCRTLLLFASAEQSLIDVNSFVDVDAIATLRNISTSDELKLAVADAGGIEKILTVMNEASPVVQAELAKAIVVLAINGSALCLEFETGRRGTITQNFRS